MNLDFEDLILGFVLFVIGLVLIVAPYQNWKLKNEIYNLQMECKK